MTRTLAAGLLALVLGSCGERCDLRRVAGCEHTPGRMQVYTAFDSEGHSRLKTRWVPEHWTLTYESGWGRRTDRFTCEREGGLRRWQLCRSYFGECSYIDAPILECGAS